MSADGVFVSIGGGVSFNVYGIGEGTSPTTQLGMGYRWSRLAVDVDFVWNSLESRLRNECWMLCSGSTGCAYQLNGNMLGGVLQGRVYLFEPVPRFQPYVMLGVGGRVLLYETEELYGFLTFNEVVKRNGSFWGLVVRAGVGIELEIVSSVFMDLSGFYDFMYYDKMVDDYDRTTQSINLVGMVKFIF